MGIESLKTEGLHEAANMLRGLGKAAKPIVRHGLRAGARVLQAAERAEAPELTGKLKKSIGVVGGRRGKRGLVSLAVAPRSGPYKGKPFVPAFVVYGHPIRHSSKRARANDFVERAWSSRDRAVEAATADILAGIDKATHT